jgi:hypothetical protein
MVVTPPIVARVIFMSQESRQPHKRLKPGHSKPHRKVNLSSQDIPYRFLTSLPHRMQ